MVYTTTPAGFLERLADYEKADEEKKTRRAEARRKLYSEIKDDIVKPVAYGLWEATKAIGRGIKKTGQGMYVAGKYVVDTYTDHQKFLDMEEKVTGVTKEQRKQAQITLDESVRTAKTELDQAKAIYERTIKTEKAASKTRRQTLKQQQKAGIITPSEYETRIETEKANYDAFCETTRNATGGLNEKERSYKTARANVGSTFARYVLDPQTNARRYREVKEVAEKLNTSGLEVTPLQIYALYKGYKDKFKEYAKPGKDEKPFREEPVLDRAGNPVNDASGNPIKMKFKTMEDWIKFQIEMLNMDIKRDEMRIRMEQMRNFGFGFAPGAAGATPGAGAPGMDEETFRRMMFARMMGIF